MPGLFRTTKRAKGLSLLGEDIAAYQSSSRYGDDVVVAALSFSVFFYILLFCARLLKTCSTFSCDKKLTGHIGLHFARHNVALYEGGSGDSHHSDHGFFSDTLADGMDDAASSGTSTPRGIFIQSPFGVFTCNDEPQDVAVKVFSKQEYSEEVIQSYRQEVSLMKRLRHPNVLLFMGAVASPSRLCIVSEFLPRGNLFRLLQRNLSLLAEDIAAYQSTSRYGDDVVIVAAHRTALCKT